MTTDSSKAFLELILLLSLPRDPDLTTFLESGNMKNLVSVAICGVDVLLDQLAVAGVATNRK